MTNKENNLSQFFTDYLNNKSELNATNITMACYSALNDIDSSLNVAEVILNMRNDFEYINKVIDDLARSLCKKSLSYDDAKQRKSTATLEYLTIPEIQSISVSHNKPLERLAMKVGCPSKRVKERINTLSPNQMQSCIWLIQRKIFNNLFKFKWQRK